MTEINLKDFETIIVIRQINLDDFNQIVSLQERCFPGNGTMVPEQFESQLTMFPEGQVCVEYEGKVVASSSSLVLDFDLYTAWHSWKEIADGGFIRNHTLEGNTLYGIEIMVDPQFRGLRLARRLYDARKNLARRYNLMCIIIGGRIPGYAKYAQQMNAREYVDKVINKTLIDPVLTTAGI